MENDLALHSAGIPAAEIISGIELCAGIGGLGLGLKIAFGDRYRTLCYIERDAYAAATLVKNMERQALDQAPIWDSLESFACRPWSGIVDIILAGYPCPPFSLSGKRAGENDSRHLWPRVAEITAQIRPRLLFCENVSDHLSLGFDSVCRDLEELDYGIAAGLFRADELGAPHKRERLYFLAFDRKRAGELVDSCGERFRARRSGESKHESLARRGGFRGRAGELGESDGLRFHAAFGEGSEPELGQGFVRLARGNEPIEAGTIPRFAFPPHKNDFAAWREAIEGKTCAVPFVYRSTDGIPYRVDRLRCLGNAVVPMVASYAFDCLAEDIAEFLADGGGDRAR